MEYLIVGRIRRAHGIRGEVVVEAITDEPDAVFAPGRRVFAGTVRGELAAGRPELRIAASSPFKEGFIVKFAELPDRNTAETWRDRYLLLPEGELAPPDEDEVYLHELPGMRVVTVGGATVGTVEAVYELPQGLAIDVDRGGEAGTVMIPFSEPTVTAVDRAARTITIDPLEGLLD